MAALKAYIVAVMVRYVPQGRVLDLGCGVGHDLVRLTRAGLSAVGVDLSQLALLRARAQSGAVVRGDGAQLPFRDGAFDGCRVERVLQHVADPGAVMDEMLRVVRPGGVVAVLEPDHTSLRIDSSLDLSGALISRFAAAKHPAVGAELTDLLRARGCLIDDIVTEQAFGYDLESLPLNAAATLARAIARGSLTEDQARGWGEEQAALSSAGSFRATWTKFLVIARTADRRR